MSPSQDQPDPFDPTAGGRGPQDGGRPESDHLGELLRLGLGRLADETPRYLDTSELRESVLTRAHNDRMSRRAVAAAAALVPIAAFAGWVIGTTGSPGTGTTAAGGASFSAAASHSPVPPSKPSSSAVSVPPGPTHVVPSTAVTIPGLASARPTTSASVAPPAIATPATSAGPSAVSVPASSPSVSLDPNRLVVQLSVVSTGLGANGQYLAHYAVSWSGGSKAPVLVLLYDSSTVVARQELGNPCAGPAASDTVEGDLTFSTPGPHTLVGVVRAGCDSTGGDREKDTVRWTWAPIDAPSASASPSPEPSPSGATTTTSPAATYSPSPAATASDSASPTPASSPVPAATSAAGGGGGG